jgi:hypothetical protein
MSGDEIFVTIAASADRLRTQRLLRLKEESW